MADFWSFAFVVGLLWYVVVPSCYIWREGTWHTPGNHPSSASRWLHTTLKLSRCKSPEITAAYATFPYRSRLPIQPSDSPPFRVTAPSGISGRHDAISLGHSFLFGYRSMIIVKWTIFSKSTLKHHI